MVFEIPVPKKFDALLNRELRRWEKFKAKKMLAIFITSTFEFSMFTGLPVLLSFLNPSEQERQLREYHPT